jgi:hypothetical protein
LVAVVGYWCFERLLLLMAFSAYNYSFVNSLSQQC